MPVNPFELAGPMMIAAAIAVAVLRQQKLGVRITGAIGGALVALVPAGPTTFGAFFLGTFGPVSAATLLLLGSFIGASILGQMRCPWPSRPFLVCLVVTGAVFYPLTFGLSNFDPYEMGYRGVAVPGLMLGFVLIGWFLRATDISCWVALAALLYVFGAYDSQNLWDYLIFPADPIFAAAILVMRARRARRSHGRPEDQTIANLENSATTRS